jgi:hypothetical protein
MLGSRSIQLSLFVALVAASLAQAQQPNTQIETEKLCKEKCEKDCMGNDTPTERAKCLEREKCSERSVLAQPRPAEPGFDCEMVREKYKSNAPNRILQSNV